MATAKNKVMEALHDFLDENGACDVPYMVTSMDTPEEAWAEATDDQRRWFVLTVEILKAFNGRKRDDLEGDALFEPGNRDVLAAIVKMLQGNTMLKDVADRLIDEAYDVMENRDVVIPSKWADVRRRYAAQLPRALVPAKPKAKAKGRKP